MVDGVEGSTRDIACVRGPCDPVAFVRPGILRRSPSFWSQACKLRRRLPCAGRESSLQLGLVRGGGLCGRTSTFCGCHPPRALMDCSNSRTQEESSERHNIENETPSQRRSKGSLLTFNTSLSNHSVPSRSS